MTNISSTTLSLLAYSKLDTCEFNWKSLRKNVLGEQYYQEMSLEDVVRVVYSSLVEVQKDPKFELHYGVDFFKQVILAPLKFSFYGKRVDDLTTEEVYDKMLAEMMYGLRFTRVDWCSSQIKMAKLKFGEDN